jgi:hypothetical protein
MATTISGPTARRTGEPGGARLSVGRGAPGAGCAERHDGQAVSLACRMAPHRTQDRRRGAGSVTPRARADGCGAGDACRQHTAAFRPRERMRDCNTGSGSTIMRLVVERHA